MIHKHIKHLKDEFYAIFRILVGFLFFSHGVQKLFGAWGWEGGAVQIASMMGVAGIIELVGGAAIILGFFTRLASLGGGLLMITAYFITHVPQGLIPIMNGGELALLYLAAFVVLTEGGAGIWSLEKCLMKKEMF